MLFWVIDGFVAPGVQFGSGKLPFTIWHKAGTIAGGGVNEEDVCEGILLDDDDVFFTLCGCLLLLGCGFWKNPPNNLFSAPCREKALAFWKYGITTFAFVMSLRLIVYWQMLLS